MVLDLKHSTLSLNFKWLRAEKDTHKKAENGCFIP